MNEPYLHYGLNYRLMHMHRYPGISCQWIFDRPFAPLTHAFNNERSQYRQEYLMIEEAEKPPVSGIDQLIHAVIEDLAPTSQLGNIMCEYVKDRKEAEYEDREGEVTPLIEASLKTLIKSRIREDSTAIVWYNLLYNNQQSIEEVAESEIDNDFVRKDTSAGRLLQLVDKLYLRERDGVKFCKNDAYIMYQVIEQNLKPAKFRNHRKVAVINNRTNCQIRLGADVYVMEAEHKNGKSYCRQTGKRFVNLLLNMDVPIIEIIFEKNPAIPVEDETEKFLFCLDWRVEMQGYRPSGTLYAVCCPVNMPQQMYCQPLRVIKSDNVINCIAVRRFSVSKYFIY